MFVHAVTDELLVGIKVGLVIPDVTGTAFQALGQEPPLLLVLLHRRRERASRSSMPASAPCKFATSCAWSGSVGTNVWDSCGYVSETCRKNGVSCRSRDSRRKHSIVWPGRIFLTISAVRRLETERRD